MNQTCVLNQHQFIIFDELYLSQVDVGLFAPKKELSISDEVAINNKGRGSVYIFEYQGLSLVLRHYCRGGMIRHFIKDTYWFASLELTRMWREFRLLQSLRALNLPVPSVIAAHCVKTSPFTYRGDLIMQKIPDSQTIAELLECAPLSDALWGALGELIARFHMNNVFHADLNANNILLTTSGEFYLIDFDRGELRDDSPNMQWKKGNIERLLRSFHKLSNKYRSFHFSERSWDLLLKAYNAF